MSYIFKFLVNDLVIDILVIEEDRPAHIAKHQITVDEVLEVLTSNYIFIAGREKRWLVIGQTDEKTFLTVIIGERSEPNTYGLITARPARRNERGFYSEYVTQQGGEND